MASETRPLALPERTSETVDCEHPASRATSTLVTRVSGRSATECQDDPMSDLSRRPSGRLTRSQREQRAFALTMATGGFAVATVVLAVLAIVGIGGFGLVVLAAIATALFGFLLRRSLGV